jgi:Protein of unknown function (DUF2892)
MKANVGNTDKVIRILLGVVIMAAGYFYSSWLGLIGIIPVLTAFMSFCPLYSIIGVSTCKIKAVQK